MNAKEFLGPQLVVMNNKAECVYSGQVKSQTFLLKIIEIIIYTFSPNIFIKSREAYINRNG